ncbi:MAG: TIGR02147 family protein [Bdellovibrio sp.]
MKKLIDVFEAKSYLHYLSSKVGDSNQRKGVKSALAKALNCQPTYITHVLTGKANLSLEQAEAVNKYFAHTKEESQVFLLLVLRDRAGTNTLKQNFQEQIDQILAQRMILTKRLGQRNVLNEEQRAIFYSTWYFLATQIGLTIPAWQTSEVLAKKLNISAERLGEVLQFLCDNGLVKKEKNRFIPGETQIRLGRDSHQILQHHTNWRMKAIESFDRETINDLHYSGVLSLSESDVVKLKNTILTQLKENIEFVKASKEEKLYTLNIDFFNLERE